MQIKFFEIRDRGTFIPAVALAFKGIESWLLRRAGYAPVERSVILINLTDGNGSSDPFGHKSGARTMQVAHQEILMKWDQFRDGQVLDVEFILRETRTPKVSERQAVEG